jgi:hypothetical protein
MQTCDTGTVGDWDDGDADATCNACMQCTMDMMCASAWLPCTAGSDLPCDLYVACEEQCRLDADLAVNGGNDNGMLDKSGDPSNPSVEQQFVAACVGDWAMPVSPSCKADLPEGWANYAEALACSICSYCTSNCSAGTYCM